MRLLRPSFLKEPFTIGCDAAMAQTVVIKPILIPKTSKIAFTVGVKPLAVHDAQDENEINGLKVSCMGIILGMSTSKESVKLYTVLTAALAVSCSTVAGKPQQTKALTIATAWIARKPPDAAFVRGYCDIRCSSLCNWAASSLKQRC